MLTLNLALIAVLLAVGLTAHSLGVLAEGADYLADAAGIVVTLLAVRLADRPATARRPQGYPHATNVAALINAGWLLVLSAFVASEATYRLATGTAAVHGLPVLVVSAVAGAVMLIGAVILGADVTDDGNLHLRAVWLDTAADAAAAAGVAVTGAIILAAGGWYWLDSLVALVIASIVTTHALKLLRRIRTALIAGAPGSRPAL